MADILLSGAVRANITTLRQTSDLLNQVQNRLATGKKVNSALDNPVNFFMATTLNQRATDLNTQLDGINNGQKTLDAASTGIAGITNLVTTLQSVANSALASVQTTARRTGTVTGLTGASSFTTTSGHTLTVSDGTTSATITFGAATTVQQVLDGVNNAVGLKVEAELSSDGRILLEATGTNAITLGGTATAAELTQFGLSSGTTAAGTLNTARSSFAAQFDSTLSQIDQLAADASFNGTNLLNGGSLTVKFNETGSSTLNVTGVTDTSAGLAVTVSQNTWQTDKDIKAALNAATAALTTLRTQSANFASNAAVISARSDFTKSLVSTLQSAASDLVSTDTNLEGANLLALQTRQQLSTTALSLATQSDQNVLQLFR